MAKVIKCDFCNREIGNETTVNDVIHYIMIEKLPCVSILEDRWDVCQNCWNRMRRLYQIDRESDKEEVD